LLYDARGAIFQGSSDCQSAEGCRTVVMLFEVAYSGCH
jgi:hypothetical protein